jgi:hypothetical protein
MDTADDVMEEIEKHEYQSDKDLSAWLREKIDLLSFDEICDYFKTDRG